MLFYDHYADVPPAEVESLLAEATLGRLITVSPEGRPHLGLFPFLHGGSSVEVHLAKGDEQLDDLAALPLCLFEVDELLATIPSYWEDPQRATFADAYYRAVLLDTTATLDDGREPLAEHLAALLRRYQPDGGYAPIDEAPALYAAPMGRLVLVRLQATRTRVKFKLGQQQPQASRRLIAERLRARGRELDLRTAAAVERTPASPPPGATP
jgi:predicted FMN-binding regulatory protein PaiB